MENESQKREFDTGTALKLLDSKESGIPLLPLSDVEQHQSTLFWAAIFFGFFTAILGSLTSLLTTAFGNYPVIYLLAIFLISYFIFFMVFAIRGFSRWKKLYKVHRDIGTHVFNGINVLPYDDFNRTVDGLLPFEPDDPRRKKFNQKLIAEGIIVIDKSEPDNWTVSYEPDFEVSV